MTAQVRGTAGRTYMELPGPYVFWLPSQTAAFDSLEVQAVQELECSTEKGGQFERVSACVDSWADVDDPGTVRWCLFGHLRLGGGRVDLLERPTLSECCIIAEQLGGVAGCRRGEVRG